MGEAGRDCNIASTSQGTGRVPVTSSQEERHRTDRPSQSSDGIRLADCWPPEPSDRKFLLFQATQFVVLCHGSPRTDTIVHQHACEFYAVCHHIILGNFVTDKKTKQNRNL